MKKIEPLYLLISKILRKWTHYLNVLFLYIDCVDWVEAASTVKRNQGQTNISFTWSRYVNNLRFQKLEVIIINDFSILKNNSNVSYYGEEICLDEVGKQYGHVSERRL